MIAGSLIGISVVSWVVNVVQSARRGPRIETADVWDRRANGQFTREWQAFAERHEREE